MKHDNLDNHHSGKTLAQPPAEGDVNRIINRHSAAAGVLGLVPIPLLDFVAITGIQCSMVKDLCQIYGHRDSDSRVSTWVTAIVGGYTASYIGPRLLFSWLKLIPVWAVASSASAAAITYGLGQVFKQHFADGGDLDAVDIPTMQLQYQSELQKAASDQPVQAAQPVQEKGPAPKKQDLTLIDGIGPKIQRLLITHGITEFSQLAVTEVAVLRALLHDGGARFNVCNPDHWPEQAALAARQDWSGLVKLKQDLRAQELKEREAAENGS